MCRWQGAPCPLQEAEAQDVFQQLPAAGLGEEGAAQLQDPNSAPWLLLQNLWPVGRKKRNRRKSKTSQHMSRAGGGSLQAHQLKMTELSVHITGNGRQCELSAVLTGGYDTSAPDRLII